MIVALPSAFMQKEEIEFVEMMIKSCPEKVKINISKKQINMVFKLCLLGDFKVDLINSFKEIIES